MLIARVRYRYIQCEIFERRWCGVADHPLACGLYRNMSGVDCEAAQHLLHRSLTQLHTLLGTNNDVVTVAHAWFLCLSVYSSNGIATCSNLS